MRLSYCPLCGARVILIAGGPSVIAGMDSTPDRYLDARRLPAHVPHRCQSDDVKVMANIYDSAAAKYRRESE